MVTLESTIENRFVREVHKLGLYTIKVVNSCGWPDRLVLLPGATVLWVELKRPGASLEPLQTHVHRTLRKMNHPVACFDDPIEAVKWVIDWTNWAVNRGAW